MNRKNREVMMHEEKMMPRPDYKVTRVPHDSHIRDENPLPGKYNPPKHSPMKPKKFKD